MHLEERDGEEASEDDTYHVKLHPDVHDDLFSDLFFSVGTADTERHRDPRVGITC